MKEYLTKNSSGEYQLVNHCFSESDIEIPEGAQAAFMSKCDQINFVKDGCFYHDGKWDSFKRESSSFKLYWLHSQLWRRNHKTQPVVDNVNQPQHYCSHPSGIECIEITRHHDFAVGNAIKYLWRAGLKSSDTEIQDLKKAVWYLQDKIKLLESSDD